MPSTVVRERGSPYQPNRDQRRDRPTLLRWTHRYLTLGAAIPFKDPYSNVRGTVQLFRHQLRAVGNCRREERAPSSGEAQLQRSRWGSSGQLFRLHRFPRQHIPDFKACFLLFFRERRARKGSQFGECLGGG